MTNYTALAIGPFNGEVSLVDTTDVVLGGPDGESNVATKQLANNTAYLYDLAKGFEDITVKSNAGITTMSITIADISRKLVEIVLVDDTFLTATLPQASTYKVGGLAVIKRKSAVTDKKVTLNAFSGDLISLDDITTTALELKGEDILVLYRQTGGWKLIHYPGVYWKDPGYSGTFINDLSNPIKYRKYGFNNWVTIKGVTNASGGSSLSTNTVVFTLPVGYRPGQEQRFTVVCGNTPPMTVVRVKANGEVCIAGDLITTSNIGVYMNIGFYAEQ
jgi:hypothetical protein